MLHIIKQYKSLLMACIINTQIGINEGAGSTENAVVSSKKPSIDLTVPEVKEKTDEFIASKEAITQESKMKESTLSKEADFTKKLSSLSRLSETTSDNFGAVVLGLSEAINTSSESFKRRAVQKALVLLGYDLSFTNKSGELVTGDDAIDGKLGNTYKKAITQFQNDLGINTTGKLDQATVDFIQKIVEGIDNKKNIQISSKEEKIENKTFTKDEKIVSLFDFTNQESFEKLKSNPKRVKELQQALVNLGYKLKGANKGVDGKALKSTLSALKKASAKIAFKVRNSQYINNKVPEVENKNLRTNDMEAVQSKITETNDAVLELTERLEITNELNKQLKKYKYLDNNGFSIEALIRKLTSTDKSSKIITEKEKYEALLTSPEQKEKLERAVRYMTNVIEHGDDILDASSNAQVEKTTFNIIKILPWLLGIYLGDIPLPFVKNISAGVDINKGVAFKNWISGGMEGEFKDFAGKDAEQTNVLKKQFSLRSVLSTLKISEEEQALALTNGLNSLSANTKALLLSYGTNILLPDLKVLQEGSFSWYEFFDKKDDLTEEIIKNLDNSLKDGNIDFSLLENFFDLIKEEGDIEDSIIKSVEERIDYFGKVMNQDKIIQKIGWLSSLGSDFQNLSILFYTKEIGGLSSFGISETGMNSLKEVYDLIILEDKEALISLLESNLELKNIILDIGTKAYKKHLLSQIPQKENLKYENVGNAKHGLPLIDLSNEEAFKIATTTTPEKESTISTLGFAYKSLVDKGEAYGISYSEFEKAFKNKKTVGIDTLDGVIINTGRKEEQETISSFKSLQENRGDTEVFQMEDITKEYSFYNEKGELITQKVTYNLYIRPDCVNTLIVPNSIETYNTVTKAPELNTQTNVLINGYIPVFIPHAIAGNLLNGSNSGGSNTGGNFGNQNSSPIAAIGNGTSGGGSTI